MGRRKFIDKRSAVTFQLVHRAQNDPLIHDESAPQMVFREVVPSNVARRAYAGPEGQNGRDALDQEFGNAVRENEGEAASYGIFFDDSKYDYMQHLRDLGTGGGNSTFVEAPSVAASRAKSSRRTGTGRDLAASIADGHSLASRSTALTMTSEAARTMLGEEVIESEFVMPVSYQNQQDLPDELSGFQPDMDPRLREVLEALEDDEYVDEEGGNLLDELAREGDVVDTLDEWEYEYGYDSDEDGWQSDATVKASGAGQGARSSSPPSPTEPQTEEERIASETATWMSEFNKFKRDKKKKAVVAAAKPAGKTVAFADEDDGEAGDARSMVQASAVGSEAPGGGRGKKRKGALTNPSSYSMTASSIARTEALTVLDDRFERYEQMYAAGDGDDGAFDDSASLMSGMTGMTGMTGLTGMSGMSGFTGVSAAPSSSSAAASGFAVSATGQAGPVRRQFESVLDDFVTSNGLLMRSQGDWRGRAGASRAGPAAGADDRADVDDAASVVTATTATTTAGGGGGGQHAGRRRRRGKLSVEQRKERSERTLAQWDSFRRELRAVE